MQTRPQPTTPSTLQSTEQKSLVDALRLPFGDAGHSVGNARCPKKNRPDSALFACITCPTVIGINALGLRVGQLASTAPSSGSVSLPVATAEAPRAGTKRAREGGSSDLTLTHVKKSRAAEALVPRVLTCGRPYIDLSWFFGNDPNGKQRKAIQQACASNAVALLLGDCKSLASAGSCLHTTRKSKRTSSWSSAGALYVVDAAVLVA